MTFIHNPAASLETAKTFTHIGSLGWISFSSFFLWFVLAFTHNKHLLEKKWFYFVLFAVPLLFVYAQWSEQLLTEQVKFYYGWKFLFGNSAWTILFYIYYLSFVGLGLYFLYRFRKNTANSTLKKQSSIIFYTVLLTLVLGTVSDVILPTLHIDAIPNIAGFFVLIWAFGVVYAMVKYRFLAITPAAAADNILSTMFDCLILLDLKGKIVTVNKATADLFGCSEDNLKGMSVDTLFPGQGKKNAPAVQILEERTFKSREFILKTSRGKKIPVLFSSSVLRDETGSPAGLVCVARDISEHKKMEEETLKSKKLESIGILAGGIAHDFNNLLSIILGNITLAREFMAKDDKSEKYLQKVEAASLRAAELAGKFIAFSSGGWLHSTELSLPRLLGKLKESDLPGDGVTYNFFLPPDLGAIYGDETQLSQVFLALFQNAAEAMPQGGRVTVRAENAVIGPDNSFLLKTGSYIKVEVTDTGKGVPAAYRDKVFDPYFSTKPGMSTKGVGLGLTICHAIIKKHEGFITLEPAEEKGTIVTLYLPTIPPGNEKTQSA